MSSTTRSAFWISAVVTGCFCSSWADLTSAIFAAWTTRRIRLGSRSWYSIATTRNTKRTSRSSSWTYSSRWKRRWKIRKTGRDLIWFSIKARSMRSVWIRIGAWIWTSWNRGTGRFWAPLSRRTACSYCAPATGPRRNCWTSSSAMQTWSLVWWTRLSRVRLCSAARLATRLPVWSSDANKQETSVRS